MSGEQQPFAPTAPQGVQPSQSGSYPNYSGGTPAGNPSAPVFNPALGNLAQPVNMPGPLNPPALSQEQQYILPNQQQQQPNQYNPFAPQQAPQQFQQPNPYAPAQPQVANPYLQPGAPQQQNPAFAFQPPPYPQQQPAQQFVPTQPQGQQPLQQAPQQPQQQVQQPAITPDAFSDPTSRAIYIGMDSTAAQHKIDLVQAFGSAYDAKNPQYVNERYLAQFDQNAVAQLKGQFQALIGVENQRTQQVVATVHQLAGGEQQWQAATNIFNQVAPIEQRKVLAELFDSGDPAKVNYAAQQILAYAKQSGAMIAKGGSPIQNPGQGSATGQMLTKEAFFQQLDMLKQAHQPGTPEYNRYYQQLVEQRQMAKNYGY